MKTSIWGFRKHYYSLSSLKISKKTMMSKTDIIVFFFSLEIFVDLQYEIRRLKVWY